MERDARARLHHDRPRQRGLPPPHPPNNQMTNTTGQRRRNRGRYRPRKASNNKNKSNSQSKSRTNGGKKNTAKTQALKPIKIKASGIMTSWKKSLGGLIRYYVHKRTESPYQNTVDQKTAEEEIDQMYYRSGCSMEDTKGAILKALGVQDVEEWVTVDMAIAKDDTGNQDLEKNEGYSETIDGKGLMLKQVVRPGEGPAHSHERWSTIIVPDWAMKKSYYFQIKNNTPLDLSCELFLDGEKVAFNAPLSANAIRTIRPDGVRYYQRHQWILNHAKRVKLSNVSVADPNNPKEDPNQQQHASQRYNGVRPDYQGKRISIADYPDPTTFGWIFTGSVQDSSVEFFEKKMNDGGLVKLDFYYTTGTIKTVLDHPTSGRNQLFRAKVTPEQFRAVMENPRVHTDQGYRRSEDRPVGNVKAERIGEAEATRNGENGDAEMKTEESQDGDKVSGETKFYARDVNYNFKTQGHQNRQAAMGKLQQSGDYAEWIKANKKEYAVIHAKFYVSIPKRMSRAPSNKGNGNPRKRSQMDPLPVPEQASVIDVKAAENCTLGTDYRTTGPPQTFGRSNVRMERINGLTDEKEWKGDPVFEKKLYYRAEHIVNGGALDADMSEDDMSEDEGKNDPSPVGLDEYKSEKVAQVEQYHADLSRCVMDEEEAEQLLRNTKNKIHLSSNVHDVDESVNLFYQDLIHRQFLDTINYGI